MSLTSPSAPAGLDPAESPRLRLARLTRAAALSVPGVLGTEAGTNGLFTVASGEERIEGVRCAADPAGGYEVAVSLVCALVPLNELADRVRAAVTSAAAAAGLTVESVSVNIAAVAEMEGL